MLVPRANAQMMGFDDPAVTVSAEAWWAPRQADEGPLVALVAVTLDHPPGLKSWPSSDQDVLPSEIAEFAIRTEIALKDNAAILHGADIQWPEPKPYPVPNPTGFGDPVEVPVYTGRATAFVPVLIDREMAAEARTIELVVSYQVCDETLCYAPEDTDAFASLPAFGEGAAPAIASGVESSTIDNAIAVAVTWDGAGTSDEPVASDAGSDEPAGASGSPAASAEVDTRNKFLGFIPVPSPDSAGGIAVVVLMGIVGGFVLNLTPCVLPVIPIKVMTLSQHAGSPGKTLMLGIWMALGVIAFWMGLGIPAALLGTVVGAIFGVWWFTAGVGVIIAIMSLGLMGLFTIQLPQSVYKVNPKADTPWGSFVFGVMTGVLGLPCFGLVAGALLVSATEIPQIVTLMIFTALGIGMALPYLILSMNPKWVDVLPRTGPASELVKQVMGLLLLGAGAYFLASGIQALILDMPWIGRQLHWWAAAIFVALACLWLVLRTLQITKSVPKRGVFAVLGVLAGGGAILFAVDVTNGAKADYQEREAQLAAAAAEAGAGGIITSTWVDYTPALFERAREEGYVVVVDFTADWCINCKVLKKTILEVDPVRSKLRGDNVVMIKADLTSQSQPGWDLMKALGQDAPPVLAVYGPGIDGDTPWMANTYTSGIVMDAIALGEGEGSGDVEAADGPGVASAN
ncbi:MAG: cytochrome c biogenesis protein CcdA [Phycisphaerales bacterium]